jgi:ubiquitin carboxyl-terminal hydrolase 5/13
MTIDVKIDIPLEYDFGALVGSGLLANEESLPESVDATQPAVDQSALDQLLSMGFGEVRCRKALIITGNAGAEVAMNWLFEHMDDPDIDQPLASASTSSSNQFSAADVGQLQDMGFTESQAKRALKETNNNMERAVDWLFSHAGDMEEDSPNPSTTAVPLDTRPAKYQLFAIVSHKGTSAHCGHYGIF